VTHKYFVGGMICDRLPINHPLAAFCRNWD